MKAVIDPATLTRKENYFLQISLIVPRPIGWVSTLSPEGVPNLAPFSFFNGVCSHPPVIMVSVADHRDGRFKDTARNILATKAFVVQGVSQKLGRSMVCSSGPYPPEVNEFEACGIEAISGSRLSIPMVKESPWAMECRLLEAHRVYQAHVFYGKVLCYYIEETMFKEGEVSWQDAEMLGRLGGKRYILLTPKWERKEEDL